ncbi:carbohydrate ABC transporter substrate-binding protein (CUT1 family) [Salana multivorans]|uniref:Carbohydrate ABC transporter substrate-binding protein (CUT1 family) n=1 Tax=Salana multivorans TaxID=120377 RepID=A0A3N2DBV7_9MICO|nr:extracellular solute-binding protein [Salana multivorans]ROR97182.1 carbohydrate ABC transporter substrate-binding protein (CUT1 family) [Salana multivorans]
MNLTRPAGVATLAALALALAACSGSTTPGGNGATGSDAGTEKVTIVVGDRPSPDQKEAVALLDSLIAQFEDEHPDVTIESVETKWEAQTFQAMLAGGTMPTVMNVAFTEPQSLIAAGQIADITDVLQETGLGEKLNPAVLDVVTDADGRVFGVPVDVYSVGLAYNRQLFEDAGLDPDAPPTTWEQVREAAAAISDATGAAGYATYTADNFGGWMTAAAVASFGGELQNADGTAATINTPEMAGYLEVLRQMRWEDDSMGSTFVYSAQPAIQDFGAGKIGMLLNLPFDYPGLILNYQMAPEDFGFTALPQATDESRTLTGGAAKIFNPKATPAELKAAVEWIEFQNFQQYFDEETAVANAAAAAKDGSIVGLPVISPVSEEAYAQLQEWIAPYVNVIPENWVGYTSAVDSQVLVPEPRTKAQETYAEIDLVLQAVLTKQDVDLDQLLTQTEDTINSKLAR